MHDQNPSRNALAAETSPYLQQHADNPVDWQPWSTSSLERARQEDKPILLSVGYSACHWCHVMAHESFEDQATADLMNALFVNIKVDREERPDVDKIYQTAHHLLTRRTGGWPLTMFLSPHDQAPFFGGTYFPNQARHGLPSFQDVLRRVADFYRDNRADISAQSEKVVAAIQAVDHGEGSAEVIDNQPIEQGRDILEQAFDPRYGGFGQAPKFPHPTNLERLLRVYAKSAAGSGDQVAGQEPRSIDQRAREIALFSLRKMALGGMYDQLGGGFCRYSVDDQWMIPHFEKMLYDNGPLLDLYTRAWQISGEALFRRVATETANWVIRDMQSPEGGYYSSLDADSEGQEGRFYVWSPDEVQRLVSEQEFPVLATRFGLNREPNFEGEAWHLHVFTDLASLAEANEFTLPEVTDLVNSARGKLLQARNQRVWPARDEKVLTSWNALMIKGMATASNVFGEARYLHSAEQALEFIRGTMWKNGRLLATYKDRRAHLAAYLDDHAFLLDALLVLLEIRWRQADLEMAVVLADLLLERFEDRERGGFYFTADDHERLLVRSKTYADDALPSGNAIAARALARLGHLLGESRYLRASESTLRSAWDAVGRIPHAHNGMLDVAEEYLSPPQTIVLRGQPDQIALWRQRCQVRYVPSRMSFAVPAGETELPGMLGLRTPRGEVCAYVCEGHHCEAPVERFDQLESMLQGTEA